MDANVAVLCFVLVFLAVFEVNSEGQYQLKKVERPKDATRVFSADHIAEYDGSDPNKPIYMAVKGIVFDVTSGADFYGKGAGYNVLVGKDSSRGVAKMSLDSKDLTHHLDGLSGDVLKSLDDTYEGVYLKKYPVVGIMDYLAKEMDVEEIFEDIHINPLTGEHQHHDPNEEL